MKTYDLKQVEEVARALETHKIIAFPTDTVYGVGVLYGDLEDLHRLKHAKNRVETKPIPMMVGNVEQMKNIAIVDERTEKIVQKYLPGALTLVLPVLSSVPPEYTNALTTVAIRIPQSDFILSLIERLNKPLLVTSANQSGAPTALTYEDVLEQLPNIDGIVIGKCDQLEASTILDCTQEELKVLRQGPITLEEINEGLKIC